MPDSTSMRHVLHLPEILYNIFGHLAPTEDWEWIEERIAYTRDLAAVARTCRAFTEPALDVLWSEMLDLTPLVRCVPDVAYCPRPCQYGFKRPLTEAEWDKLRSYGRRVWVFRNCSLRDAYLDEETINALWESAGSTLFPNLRYLSWYNGKPFPLHIAAKPLRRLKLDFRRADISACRNILDSVGTLCPMMSTFRLHMSRQHTDLDDIISDHVLRWSNIRKLDCREVAFRADTILHVSRMSTLTHLGLALSKEVPSQILPSDSILVLPNLTCFDISSGWLLPVAELFARIRLPAIKELCVRFPGAPSKQTFRSFMTALRGACLTKTLTHLCVLSQRHLLRRLNECGDAERGNYSVGYDDLYPCTAFGSLRVLKFSLLQPISMTDDDLLELASSWPHLRELTINHDTGWRSPSTGGRGLTLNGFVRLLRACALLRTFSLLLDTPTFAAGLTEGVDVSFPPRRLDHVNLIDSPLEPEMFAGVVDVFVKMGFAPMMLMAWVRPDMEVEVSETRQSWLEVDAEVKARLQSMTGSDKGDGVGGARVVIQRQL